MSLWRAIRRRFRRRRYRSIRPVFEREDRRADASPWTVRRWDTAQTDSLNTKRWQYATGQSINTDLSTDLPTLMARCAHEYANNPLFEGVVNTFKDDVVGSEGPMLQVVSDDERFNSEIERQWHGLFALPNPGRKASGGSEMMKQWVHCLLTAGSYINVFTQPPRQDLISFGWKSIHPRRLVTPQQYAGDQNVAFGIRVNADGDPIEYYIDKPTGWGSYNVSGVDFDTLKPWQLQHCYIEIEPEQMTGYPMMASTLDTAADIRELDRTEIRAQKRAAAHSLGLQAMNPDAILDPEPVDSTSYPMSEDEINVAPLGWAWQQLDANRPSSEHIAYRRERIAELGRPFGMPLLVILLSVADVNFSSAQFGGMLYADTVRNIQGYITRRTLNELVDLIILETVLSSGGTIQRPRQYECVWTHNVPPNANIEKFVKALRTLIEDGVISRSMATAWLGFDPERVAASRARDIALAEQYGVSVPPTNAGSGGRQAADEEQEEPEESNAAAVATT